MYEAEMDGLEAKKKGEREKNLFLVLCIELWTARNECYAV